MATKPHEPTTIQSKTDEYLVIPDFNPKTNKEFTEFIKLIDECSERLKVCEKSDIIPIFKGYISTFNINTDNEFLLYLTEKFGENDRYLRSIIDFIRKLIYTFKDEYSENIFESPDLVFNFITKLSNSLKNINTPIHIDNNIHDIYNNKVFAKLNELYITANYNYTEQQEESQTQEEKDLFNRYLSNYNCNEVNLLDLINIIIDIEKYNMVSSIHRRLLIHLETKVKNMLIIKNLFNTVTIMMTCNNFPVSISPVEMYNSMSNIICSNLLIYDNLKSNKFTFENSKVKKNFVDFKNTVTNNITMNIYQLIYLYTTCCNRDHIVPQTWSLSDYLKELFIWNTELITNCSYINVFNNYIYISNNDTFEFILR